MSRHRVLTMALTIALCALALLVGAMTVSALPPDGAVYGGWDALYPWPEPRGPSADPSSVWLTADGPYAKYDTVATSFQPLTFQYTSGVTENISVALLDLSLKNNLSDPVATDARGYCVDIGQYASATAWLPYCRATSAEVAYVLNHYYPAVASLPAGLSNAKRAAAVQAALWHYTDGAVLLASGVTPADVYAAYEAILLDADANAAGSPPIPADLVLSPETEINNMATGDTTHTVTALVTNSGGNPLSGVTVSFRVTRNSVVVGSGSDVTDANGEATFTYTGPTITNPNDYIEDTIYAWASVVQQSGLQFCDDLNQDLVLAKSVPITVDDIVKKYWEACVEYEVELNSFDPDCDTDDTTLIYIVKGADQTGGALDHWSVGVCALPDINANMFSVQYIPNVDCNNPSLTGWQNADWQLKAPADSEVPGWSIRFNESVAPGTCAAFKIVVQGLWLQGTGAWYEQAGTHCSMGGVVGTLSCTPYLPPACDIEAPEVVCEGETDLDACGPEAPLGRTYTYAWTITGGSIPAGTETQRCITWDVAAGATSVKLYLKVTDENGCSSICDQTVDVTAKPVISLAPKSFCEGEINTTLTVLVSDPGDCDASQLTYRWWSKPAGSPDTAWTEIVAGPGQTITDTVAVATNVVGVFDYKVEVCCGDCCNTAQTTVTIMPTPVVVLDDEAVCEDDSLTLTPDVSNCDGTPVYTWSKKVNGVWQVVGSSSSYVVDTTIPGIYEYRVEVCCNGCCDVDTATVTVYEEPVVSATGDTACVGESAQLSAAILRGCTGPATYTWYKGTVVVGTGATLPFTAVTMGDAGTYRVVAVCTETGCEGEDTAILTVNPVPVVNATGDEVCVGEDASLSATILSGCTGPATYTWYKGAVVVGTGATLPFTSVTAGDAGTYRVVAVCTETGCEGEDTATLTVNPLPEVSATGDEVCVGEDTSLSATILSGCTGPATYTWYKGTVMVGTGPTLPFTSVTTGDAGTYRVVVVCTETGCENEATATLTVHPNPQCSISGPTEGCVGVEYTYTAPAGMATYAWYVDGVLQSATGNTLKWVAQDGQHVIKVTLTDQYGCQATCEHLVSMSLSEFTVIKFHDLNRNGIKDQNEPLLGGWHFVVVDATGAVVAQGDTDAFKGDIVFDDLPCGVYTVTETLKSGWMNSTPLSQQVTVVLDESPEVYFGNYMLSSISGCKFNDLDGDGLWDLAEPSLSGWTIQLHDATGAVISTTTTVDGCYEFKDLLPGLYTVTEVQQPDWVQTHGPDPINLGVGVTSTDNDFGNFHCVEIYGYKWNDLDGDGVWDQGEPPIPGWQITISTPPPLPPDMFGAAEPTAIGNLTTDANGRWSFRACGPEPWTITEEQRTGWVPTTVTYYQVTLTSGQELGALNFGNFQCYEVSGHKWNDLNGNGVWDQGEPPIAGWIITLDGQLTDTTDAQGYWSFQICDTGSHTVVEEQRAGWTPTTVARYTFSSTSGKNVSDLDFGNSQCAEVFGFKWEDLDGDGVWDAIEQPIEGWTITLDGATTDLTDATGRWSFLICDADEHQVVEESRTGWTATTVTSYTFSITNGEDVGPLNFGNQQSLGGPKFLRGIKFWDLNGNGRNDGDPGLAGIKVRIRDGSGNLLAEVTTGSGGAWVYEEPLRPGRYIIEEVVPAGWVRTYPAPNNGIYLVDVVDLGSTVDWTLVSPEPLDWHGSLDFGNARPMGFKWHDRNANGLHEANEELLGNWRILVKDMDFNIVYETHTVSNYGSPFHGYWFLGAPLPEGDYYVVEEQRDGWTQTYPQYIGYKIHLRANGSYDVLSAPQSWMDGLSFGNWDRSLGGSCPICVEWAVFQSDRIDNNTNIFRMNMDGGGVLQLTEHVAADVSPSWRFDGAAIAFSTLRDGDWEIYTMTPDGEMETNVINRPNSAEMEPSWNCEWIAFQSDRDANWEIYKVNPEVVNGPQIRLTDNLASDVAPAWSPSGGNIAFQSNRDGNWEIYLMSGEGEATSLRRLTNNPAVDRNPAWMVTQAEALAIREGRTGDYGNWLVFESDRAQAGKFDLYKMHIGTGEIVRLTDDAADSMDPAGMPYCDLILFETDRDGSLSDVWRMGLDGLNERNITLNDIGPDYWFDAMDEIPGYNLGYIPEEPTNRVVLPLVVR